MLQILKILIILIIVVQTISCASFIAKAPENFAAYNENEGDTFRAISSDGVLYRVSAYKQKSEASMDFWREAFLLNMKNLNYKQEDSLNVSISGKATMGYIFSFANSTGQDLYLVVAVPNGNKMLVVEATGETSKFENRKKDILDAIANIKVN
ncbi:MAG: hypothetical protein LBC64_10690 [Fibromonadaceae bacterium]|jgi:hypothetical protein|nr:hypothetical protein [Fibromonadaceae bacterium]